MDPLQSLRVTRLRQEVLQSRRQMTFQSLLFSDQSEGYLLQLLQMRRRIPPPQIMIRNDPQPLLQQIF